MLINTKDINQIYTDKIHISNINLKAIDLATEEDKINGLVLWAKLFKAESWEELNMLAQENPKIDQTISSVWQLTQDEEIREQMRRREENEYICESMRREVEEAKRKAEEAERNLEEAERKAEKAAEKAVKEAAEKAAITIAEKDQKIEELMARIRELETKNK